LHFSVVLKEELFGVEERLDFE
jgi:hypothetical protein